ncbi:hypothetical protein, partial [Salmonella enterica]|uniref:hypothetical protein n=1 Tax=Salmonella enterica TaxID=28901 RepID=UPI001C3E678F
RSAIHPKINQHRQRERELFIHFVSCCLCCGPEVLPQWGRAQQGIGQSRYTQTPFVPERQRANVWLG